MADVEMGSTGAEEASGSSSETVALTAEQRDEATIARLLGTRETADEADTTDTLATGEDEEATDAADEADSEEDAADDDELPEVTDEDIETILDALDDRLLNHPRVTKLLEERAKADADRRYEERRRAELVGQESERLIRQGRTAVENVHNLFTKLKGNLEKALAGDDIDPSSIKFDSDELMRELGAFGAAAVAEARRDSDSAFADAFREGAQLGGEMTDEEKDRVVKIVQTAQRIANDPEQGRSASLQYLFKENVKFLVERAKAAGKREAEAALLKKRGALEKVLGQNGTKAAVAKLAATRKKLPARPAARPNEAVQPRANMEAYRAAKAAGDHERADEILREMAMAR